MFQSQILFVVGAGASREAGLPIGSDLKSEIARRVLIKFEHGWKPIAGDVAIVDALRHHVTTADGQSGDINPYIHAGWHIAGAMPQAISVDNFIESHQGNEKIETCGKLAIVQCILEAERQSSLFVDQIHGDSKIDYDSLNDTWYNKFMQILSEGCCKQDLAQCLNNVSFIIFNYDRCIEHFLLHSLQNYYGIESAEAVHFTKSVKIIHPYGVVGKLPWQGGEFTVPFGGSNRSGSLLSLSKQIKTFTERVEDEEVVLAMRQLVQSAETIVFLGFAFHQQNMKLITPPQPGNAKRIFSTSLGISASDRDVVEGQILNLIDARKGDVRIDLGSDTTCDELFRIYWRSLALA